MLYDISHAVRELNPDIIWQCPVNREGIVGHAFLAEPYSGTTYDDIDWYNVPDSITIPSREDVEAKLTELNTNEAMRLLRVERDRLLTETDWWASTDLTITQAQRDYRQALRDLPSSSTPSVGEDGELLMSSVTWPTKP